MNVHVDGRELAEYVGGESPYRKLEQETSFLFSRADADDTRPTAKVESRDKGITRRLILHEHFNPAQVYVLHEHRPKLVDLEEYISSYRGDNILGARGQVPIGALKLRKSVRKGSHFVDVISDTGGGR